MASAKDIVNPIDPSVIDKCSPDFVNVYNKYQGTRLAAHHVPYEVYNQDRAKYSLPAPEFEGDIAQAASITVHKIPVTTPPGEIAVQMIKPTADAIEKGGLQKDVLLPAYLDFHGGGFVIGTLDTDVGFCQNVAHHVGCAVVNVDYRLSPEYPHPTPVMDSFDALKWVVSHASKLGIDAARLAVGGFSAGGCLAAALAIMVRDDPARLPPLKLQLLVVPVLDCRHVPEEGGVDPDKVPYESYAKLEKAPCLPMARLVWFYNLWLGTGSVRRENANDFRASPMVAASHANLAPASIHCAGLDPLVDEGRKYWEQLRAAEGTKTTSLTVYSGVGHPFAHWTRELPAAREFHENAYQDLRQALKID
ncbi:unnamed protein product [Discula destructiva]